MPRSFGDVTHLIMNGLRVIKTIPVLHSSSNSGDSDEGNRTRSFHVELRRVK